MDRAACRPSLICQRPIRSMRNGRCSKRAAAMRPKTFEKPPSSRAGWPMASEERDIVLKKLRVVDPFDNDPVFAKVQDNGGVGLDGVHFQDLTFA